MSDQIYILLNSQIKARAVGNAKQFEKVEYWEFWKKQKLQTTVGDIDEKPKLNNGPERERHRVYARISHEASNGVVHCGLFCYRFEPPQRLVYEDVNTFLDSLNFIERSQRKSKWKSFTKFIGGKK